MADKYSDSEKQEIEKLLKRLWARMGGSRYSSYARIALRVNASRTTVWRWWERKSLPSRWHLMSIRKFLGYSQK